VGQGGAVRSDRGVQGAPGLLVTARRQDGNRDPSFEGQAGVLGTIHYLEWLGRELAAEGDRVRRCSAQ
jgi:hypothetical protein